MLVACLKMAITCRIIRNDGRIYDGVNRCDVSGLESCPRVAAGCDTGEGYELCGCVHAEAHAAELAAESQDIAGTAYLYGHSYLCRDCQAKLIAVNVRTFHIVR